MSEEATRMQGPVNVRGRWEHCSPELLSAGIDCEKTPRRACECKPGGSHDHFISDDRLEVETFDASGRRVEWSIGPTQDELEAAHLAGTCHAFCAYCITESEERATVEVEQVKSLSLEELIEITKNRVITPDDVAALKERLRKHDEEATRKAGKSIEEFLNRRYTL